MFMYAAKGTDILVSQVKSVISQQQGVLPSLQVSKVTNWMEFGSRKSAVRIPQVMGGKVINGHVLEQGERIRTNRTCSDVEDYRPDSYKMPSRFILVKVLPTKNNAIEFSRCKNVMV
jgi:hypothetical protein